MWTGCVEDKPLQTPNTLFILLYIVLILYYGIKECRVCLQQSPLLFTVVSFFQHFNESAEFLDMFSKSNIVCQLLDFQCLLISQFAEWLSVSTVSLTVCLLMTLLFSPPPVDFHEPRVIELWEAARRSNLTEDELDSLKVVLHFQYSLFLHTTAVEHLLRNCISPSALL